MSDFDTDGALAPADDNALFSSATSGDLDTLPEPDIQAEPQPEPIPAPEPAIPPSRLREEADARRQAERERDELRGRLAAFEQSRPQPTPAPKPDVFEDPSAFVRGELQPVLDPLEQRISQITETYSRRDAVREHGQEKVNAAFMALDQAAKAGDPDAIQAVSKVKKSMDPYGDIVSWHTQKEILSEVGKDPKAYRQRIIDEALKDPEVQKRFLETTRTAAQANPIARPAVSSTPSLSRVGAAALPDAQDNASDAELFASATRAKR
jgi:hypothetical protein